jgi:hypothetical protein
VGSFKALEMGQEEDGMDIFLKMDLVIMKMGAGEI